MVTLLAGDVGGTKTSLRLIDSPNPNPAAGEPWHLLHQSRYMNREFSGLVPMVRKFLQEAELQTAHPSQPQKACFAVAGPVAENSCKMTNLNWSLDGWHLQQELEIPQVGLINDFAAVGYGVLGLKDSELTPLQLGKPRQGSPIAVIGAGTGLGEAFLTKKDGNGYQVYPTEGSHADFAPRNREQVQLLEYLLEKLPNNHVSVERVVSGSGIVAIYQFLRDSGFATESEDIKNTVRIWAETPDERREEKEDPAPLISKAALDKCDSLCERTMQIFVEAYGAEAGNLALKILPFGGLYLAGGITGKILELIQQGNFLNEFTNKGRMKPLLEKIPVYIVLTDEVGLIGATICVSQM
jgi:glucokinase